MLLILAAKPFATTPESVIPPTTSPLAFVVAELKFVTVVLAESVKVIELYADSS